MCVHLSFIDSTMFVYYFYTTKFLDNFFFSQGKVFFHDTLKPFTDKAFGLSVP
jgi:hypothetical protein